MRPTFETRIIGETFVVGVEIWKLDRQEFD